MRHSIIVQYPYETIDIALCKQGKIIQSFSEHKFHAVSLTIPLIQELLTFHNLQLCDLDFIGVNVGPGPYNTLRALLTMANGINTASKVPLITASALELLEHEHPNNNTIVLLHAFAGHVFYRMKINNEIKQGGCSIQDLALLANKQLLPMLALGNGATAHQAFLHNHCKSHIVFPEIIPTFNKLETLAQITYEKFVKQEIAQSPIRPIYFEELR